MPQRVVRYHARWVLPVASAPVADGTVAARGGQIIYVGDRAGAPRGDEDRDLGDAVLLPGLVNAHTHLELTFFRGLLEDVPFVPWIRRLQRAKVAVMTPERSLDAARLGVLEGLRAGITSYGDCCDSGISLRAMCDLGVRGVMYQEVFGPSPHPEDVDASVAGLEAKLRDLAPSADALRTLGVSPHAPYTVSDPLFARVAGLGFPMAIHAAESADEEALIARGEGEFAAALRARGIPVAPRARTPIEMLDRLGVLAARPLLVHAVRVDEADIARIAAAGCAVAHCPISNAKLGHGVAPLLELLAAGVTVGIGSDSVASNNRLDLLEEARVAALAQRARGRSTDALPARQLLGLLTLGGARALGLDRRVGSLEVGKDADLAAFSLDGVPGTEGADPAVTLLHALGGAHAVFVAVRGEVRVQDGRLTGEGNAAACDTRLRHRAAATSRDLAEALAAS